MAWNPQQHEEKGERAHQNPAPYLAENDSDCGEQRSNRNQCQPPGVLLDGIKYAVTPVNEEECHADRVLKCC